MINKSGIKLLLKKIGYNIILISGAIVINYILLEASIQAPYYLCAKNTSTEVCVGNVHGFIALTNFITAVVFFKYRKFIIGFVLIFISLSLIVLLSAA